MNTTYFFFPSAFSVFREKRTLHLFNEKAPPVKFEWKATENIAKKMAGGGVITAPAMLAVLASTASGETFLNMLKGVNSITDAAPAALRGIMTGVRFAANKTLVAPSAYIFNGGVAPAVSSVYHTATNSARAFVHDIPVDLLSTPKRVIDTISGGIRSAIGAALYVPGMLHDGIRQTAGSIFEGGKKRISEGLFQNWALADTVSAEASMLKDNAFSSLRETARVPEWFAMDTVANSMRKKVDGWKNSAGIFSDIWGKKAYRPENSGMANA